MKKMLRKKKYKDYQNIIILIFNINLNLTINSIFFFSFFDINILN